jgi:Protein of unknown function (DUF3095)
MADAFYAGVPVFDGFNRIVEPALYKPLPDGWTLGLADIVGSTSVIAAGRYKAVNMAGASVITAVANAVGTPEFPFVFGAATERALPFLPSGQPAPERRLRRLSSMCTTSLPYRFARQWCLSRPFGRRGSTCGSPASHPHRT